MKGEAIFQSTPDRGGNQRSAKSSLLKHHTPPFFCRSSPLLGWIPIYIHPPLPPLRNLGSLPYPATTCQKQLCAHRLRVYLPAMPVAFSPSADWEMHRHALTTNHSNTHYVSFLLKHTWDGLALFAIFIIVRHTARRILVWWRGTDTSSAPSSSPDPSEKYSLPKQESVPREGPVLLSPGQPYQRLHYLFPPPAPPPFWMMDDQAGNFSAAPCGDDSKPFGQGSTPGETRSQGEGIALGDSGSPPRPRPEPTLQRYLMMRPPPPPPLTPPALSPSDFSRNGHNTLYHTTTLELDSSFIHQPNPDYLASTRPPLSPPLPTSPTFTKSQPVDIPAPLQQRRFDSSVSAETEDGSSESAPHGGLYSSNSFPTINPYLPPAPPDHEGYPLPEKSVEVQGEVISVTDGYGTGWTRHTRVYGGGVCLACAASGGEGGFYGATAFRPDDRG